MSKKKGKKKNKSGAPKINTGNTVKIDANANEEVQITEAEETVSEPEKPSETEAEPEFETGLEVEEVNAPTQAEKESETAEPSEPSEPSESSEPSEPSEPSESSEPSEPSEPSDPSEPSKPSSKEDQRSVFYLTTPEGKDVKMRILGYARTRGKVFAVTRPEPSPGNKAAIFSLFYRDNVLCFRLVKDEKLCRAVFKKYVKSLRDG